MVGVCVRTEESGVFDDPVLYHRDCDDCDLDDLLYSGGVLTGEISVSGKKSIYAVLPADLTNAFPKLGIYTSIAVLFYKYGLMGTYAGVIIIHMINSMMFMVWLPSSAFRNVHRQQEEAARDAGASPVRTFFKVTLPMAMPGIAVATLYTFLGSMEEAQGTMLVGLARIQTMPVAMYGIVLDSSAIQIGAVFAILLIIPSALLIFVMRKYIGPEAIAGGFKMK